MVLHARRHPRLENYDYSQNGAYFVTVCTKNRICILSGPTLGTVVRAIKTLTTKQIGRAIWQAKFHDHIIRDDNDFMNYWQYIDGNPGKWAEDEYYEK